MKKLLYLSVSLIFTACNFGNNNPVETTFKEVSDSIRIEVNFFEPELKILPILDSITDALNMCPVPKGKITEMIIIVENRAYGLEVYFATISDYLWDYSDSRGVFEYNGYKFYYSGVVLEELFIIKEKRTSLSFPNLEGLYFDPDERCYKWVYALKNGILEGILVKDCNKLWVNWDFFEGED